jgi:hypothetical protein
MVDLPLDVREARNSSTHQHQLNASLRNRHPVLLLEVVFQQSPYGAAWNGIGLFVGLDLLGVQYNWTWVTFLIHLKNHHVNSIKNNDLRNMSKGTQCEILLPNMSFYYLI